MESYTYNSNRRILSFKIKLTFVKIQFFKGLKYLFKTIAILTLSQLRNAKNLEEKLSNKIEKFSSDNKGLTLHLLKVVPLDSYVLRLEFSVNRKKTYWIHIISNDGSYKDIFSKYKRNEEFEIDSQQLYMHIRFSESDWKLKINN